MDKAKKAKILSCVRAVLVLAIAFVCILFLIDIPVSMFILNEKPLRSSGILNDINNVLMTTSKN